MDETAWVWNIHNNDLGDYCSNSDTDRGTEDPDADRCPAGCRSSELVEVHCSHEWVAGICVVNPQDLQSVVANRDVECDKCGMVLTQGSEVPSKLVWCEY